MPGLNRKGPNGEGPMTGNQQGLCNPKNKDKDFSSVSGRGQNKKEGRGLGLRKKKGRGLGKRFRNRQSR
jgi:hypothetical protein